MRRYYLAAAALVALFVAAAPLAGATNVDVSVSSACQGTTWAVTATAHNVYTQPLDVRFDNSVELVAFHLDPGQQQSSHIFAPGQTFTYQWSATTAHLIGDGVYPNSVTLTRPEGCGVLTQQTEPPTTTCAAAIPPRTDCGGTTTSTSPSAPSPSVPATTAPGGGPPATPVPGTLAPTATPTSVKPAPTTSKPIALPTTGSSSNAILAAALGLIAVGSILAATRRGRRA